jgi:hypothetical protein
MQPFEMVHVMYPYVGRCAVVARPPDRPSFPVTPRRQRARIRGGGESRCSMGTETTTPVMVYVDEKCPPKEDFLAALRDTFWRCQSLPVLH